MKILIAQIAVFFTLTSSLCASWDKVKDRSAGEEMQVRSGNLWDWGKFVRATDDELVIQMRTGQATIPKTDIDEVRVFVKGRERRNRALKAGLVAGSLTAGLSYPILRVGGHPNPGLMSAAFAAGPGITGAVALSRSGNMRIYKRGK